MSWLALLLCLTPAAVAPQVQGEKAGDGVYRFHGEAEIAGPAAPLVAMVTAYDQQCRRGCRYEVPAVDRTILLPGEREGRFHTWTYVDDLLDASYFVAVEVEREGALTTVRYRTPAAEDLARLADAAHPHEPFFEHQDGRWTFEELPAAPDGGPRTRVTADLEMRSKQFLVNLMPGQILERTEKHLLLIYRHLEAAAAAAKSSGAAGGKELP